MESGKIEILLKKYFQAETSIAEENALKNYFTSMDVVAHLSHYKPMFTYLSQEKETLFSQEISLPSKKNNGRWLSIAATFILLIGLVTFALFKPESRNNPENLGTYTDPEIAFLETQKVLALLSENVNVGIGSVQFIKEYEATRDTIFIK